MKGGDGSNFSTITQLEMAHDCAARNLFSEQVFPYPH